jgi:hypothetical protein
VDETAARFRLMPLTLGQKLLVQGFELQLRNYGHILMSGTNSFPCLMAPANPVELAMSDGFPDPREITIAEVLNTDLPSWVVAQMALTDENGQVWTTINRDNNPSGITAKLWLIKKTSYDN